MSEEQGSDSFACPDCDMVAQTRRGLSQHRAKVHGILSPTSSRQRDSGPRPSEPPRPIRMELSEADQGELRDRLIGHFAMIGGFIAAFAPHTGLTLVSRAVDREDGVRGPDGRELADASGRPIRLKHRGIATILLDYGRRDPRIMRGLLAFDRLMAAQDEVEIVAQLAAAVAVDTGRVDPHEGIGLPGTPIRLAPDLLIPDVVAEVEAAYAAQAAEVEAAFRQGQPEQRAAPSENVHGRAPDGVAVATVPGGDDTG